MSRLSLLVVSAAVLIVSCGRGEPPVQAQAEELATAEAVAEAVRAHQARFAAAPGPEQAAPDSAYQFVFDGLSTPTAPMSAFASEVVLVVNTASKCGYTPQYAGLQTLYEEYGPQGFSVLGVPSGDFREQELETAEEIREFCTLNFGVTFPMAGRTHVTGEQAHPFYRWARQTMGDDAVPAWNFHKLLIDRQGRLIAAFPSATEPTSPAVRQALEQALA